jgi:hypothetical protein
MSKTDDTILLGYSVGKGEPVRIPAGHMLVSGTTQLSGKTTTLEALVQRSGLTALAFITKRGEGSFTTARRALPFFREGAGDGRPYWEYVESLMASTMGQKMKFERAWTVKAARGAHTLAQVRENVAKLMAGAKRDMDRDIFMLLAEYLDIVLPQIKRLPPCHSLDLSPGLNVMDLTEYTDEMQMLIVRSAVEWIHRHESGVVTILPEAWKFIPEAKMTPVKPAVERLVREGAGLRNFVWTDAQDIAGIWKLMLRATTVFLVGVQREANEVKRTLSNIPDDVSKPKAKDVMTLTKGQFYACFGRTAAKTYVRPVWMDDAKALAVAVSGIEPTPAPRAAFKPFPAPCHRGSRLVPTEPEEDDMASEDVKELKEMMDQLLQAQAGQMKVRVPEVVDNHTDRGVPIGPQSAATPDEDALYQRFRARLLKDPVVLKVALAKPEIDVEIVRQTVEVDGATPKGRVARLLAGKFFDTAKRHADVKREMERSGPEVNNGTLSRLMKEMVAMGFVTEESEGYKAVEGMKVNIIKK